MHFASSQLFYQGSLHQDADPSNPDVFQMGPSAASGGQHIKAAGYAASSAPAHGEFAQEYRNPQDQQEQQIQQDESRSAVLAAQVGKFSHISDADGAAGADQDEAQTGLEGITGALLF